MESFSSYLPHNDKVLWEKVKISISKTPNDFKDLNDIFFKGKCHFFEEINKKHKKEGEEFFKIYKHLQLLALDSENILPKKIPLLKKDSEDKYELTRKQTALIFLLSFFNLLDLNQFKERETNPFVVFEVLQSSKGTKFEFARCFLNYLTIIGKWLSEKNQILDEKIKFFRTTKYLDINNLDKNKNLCQIKIYKEGSLSNGETPYFVDFANMFIGGGVFEGGCVQEEILFASRPEATVAMFFMEVMSEKDAIRIDNAIKYSNYSGYARSFKFDGSAINDYNFDKIKKNNKIIAIDACIQKNDPDGIIEIEDIKRDILKAYSGFMLVHCEKNEKEEEKSISTGNWGCGAFGGDHELKFFQQWVSASFAGIQRIDYYTFGSKEMEYIIENLDKIKKKYTKAYKLYEILTKNQLICGSVGKFILKGKMNKKIEDCSII